MLSVGYQGGRAPHDGGGVSAETEKLAKMKQLLETCNEETLAMAETLKQFNRKLTVRPPSPPNTRIHTQHARAALSRRTSGCG